MNHGQKTKTAKINITKTKATCIKSVKRGRGKSAALERISIYAPKTILGGSLIWCGNHVFIELMIACAGAIFKMLTETKGKLATAMKRGNLWFIKTPIERSSFAKDPS